MPPQDGFIRWHLLGAGGLPSLTPFKKLIDIQISSPYVALGQHQKVPKVTNSSTRLCSYIPETKNVVISGEYTLKTSNSREGIIKMVSEFSPAGIIGAAESSRPTTSSKFCRASSSSGPAHCMRKKNLGPSSEFRRDLWCTLPCGGIQHEAEHRFLNISKIHVGPVELKRLKFTPADLISDQARWSSAI